MKLKSCLLKRFFFLNDKPLAKHIKKKERVQIKKVRNEKEATTGYHRNKKGQKILLQIAIHQ